MFLKALLIFNGTVISKINYMCDLSSFILSFKFTVAKDYSLTWEPKNLLGQILPYTEYLIYVCWPSVFIL